MIEFIDINKIHHHPDNPRKDLGDLVELAESIKTRGILQNLTVVPYKDGGCMFCRHFNPQLGSCTIDYNGSAPCASWESKGAYTVVIGHRRLAAAKLAGLTEVPCVVTNMDYKTQIATMLLENIQRSDLTAYEQAQGFQMMLNLGETMNGIAEKTGFSETTIRRRTKLLELDQDKLLESMERGATLSDYVRLEQIKDIDARNEVLEKIGTGDFEWSLKSAITDEARREKINAILEEIKQFAIEAENTEGLIYVDAYSGRPADKFEVPEDADEVKYFYDIKYGYIYLYCEKPDDADSRKEEEDRQKKKEEKERIEKLNELSDIARELRQEFIENYTPSEAKKNAHAILEQAIITMAEQHVSTSYEQISELLELETNEGHRKRDIIEKIEECPERVLLVAIYSALNMNYLSYVDWDGTYSKSKHLDRAYTLLEKLGYEISEEESALKDGTHELFRRGRNKN